MTSQKINPIPTKQELCATFLYKRNDAGIFQLEALKEYGETDLRTVISRFRLDHGIDVQKKPEPHTHRSGGKVYFKRYFVTDEEERQKLKALIDDLRLKRGLPPYSPNDYQS